jgi:anaerobic dimethyl sulfoxide reductase subunit C (anchor subunit)
VAGGALQTLTVFAHAFAINGSAGLYSADIGYYFDPTLPDRAMVDATSVMQSIFTGSQAVVFWLGVVIVGAAAALVLICLPRRFSIGRKSTALSVGALICAGAGGICWRVILYVAAVSVFALY